MTRGEWARRRTRTSSWIRRSTRLAIYHRDGHRCVYCRRSPGDGARLSLDHLRPRWRRGVHHPTNLVTACLRCNGARQGRSLRAFVQWRTQERVVRRQAQQPLNRAAGRALAAGRMRVLYNVKLVIDGVALVDRHVMYAEVA